MNNNKTRIMDIELRKILEKVYANKMKPDEAQWKICVLFNVSNNEVVVCDCPIPSTTIELPHRCIKCNKPIKWD